MYRLEVYLKSGHTMVIECESFTFQFSYLSGCYTGYELTGMTNVDRAGIVPDQIAGYTAKEITK